MQWNGVDIEPKKIHLFVSN